MVLRRSLATAQQSSGWVLPREFESHSRRRHRFWSRRKSLGTSNDSLNVILPTAYLANGLPDRRLTWQMAYLMNSLPDKRPTWRTGYLGNVLHGEQSNYQTIAGREGRGRLVHLLRTGNLKHKGISQRREGRL